MKAPSKNVTASLKSQETSGRGDYSPQRSGLGGGITMTVPGEGGTSTPPGAERMERSAAKAADAMGGIGKMRGGA